MKNKLKAVEAFHNAFGIKNRKEPVAFTSKKEIQLRYDLMDEENKEYLEAALNNDLVEVADALGDMLYILCGTMLSHGMQDKMEDVFNEIQKSNMSKLGVNGKPIYRNDGKVMKGPNYFKPNIEKILSKK
jgi:predicted HAD superfamily Cof-like phosphohydrolase